MDENKNEMNNVIDVIDERNRSELEMEFLTDSVVRREELEWDNSDLADEESCSRVAGKRKEREEESSEEGFITVIKRKPKRLLMSDTVNLRNELSRKQNDTEEVTEPFEVCVTSLAALPKQMALAKLLRSEHIQNITRIRYKSPYKVLIRFETDQEAEKLINCQKFRELDYRCQKTSVNTLVYGIVRGVDLELHDKEIMEILECNAKIISVKRLDRMEDGGKWIKSETVRICFEEATLPSYVYAYGCRFKVESYVFPVNQCSGCWKFGHLLKFCPIKKKLCPKCGSAEHSNCEVNEYKCLNCKGSHMVLDKSCPVFLKEKTIRNIMCKENLTYRKALQNVLEKAKKNTSEQVIVQNVNNIPVEVNNNRESYSNAVTRAIVHCEDINETSGEEDGNITEKMEQNNKRTHKRRRGKHMKQADDQAMKCDEILSEVENTNTTKEGQEERRFDLRRLLAKIRTIVVSQVSLECKVKSVIKAILDECKMFILSFFVGGNIFETLLDIFNYG